MTKEAKKLELAQAKLLARKTQLEAELTELYHQKVNDGQVQDLGDQISSSTSETLRSSLQDSDVEEYNRLIKALEMVQNGSYGVCEDCGMEISTKRLESYPDASRCISCQEIYEESQTA
ncbi:MAG: DnaK suppressor protein [candidate division TM6 bacterium GW2011_GWF2_32_72]|nr:MAG: DnaK suppressor protein [candidate division TM6 bacterium GW2011_GWF2_32_72]